jgi:hypothetical protein
MTAYFGNRPRTATGNYRYCRISFRFQFPANDAIARGGRVVIIGRLLSPRTQERSIKGPSAGLIPCRVNGEMILHARDPEGVPQDESRLARDGIGLVR